MIWGHGDHHLHGAGGWSGHGVCHRQPTMQACEAKVADLRREVMGIESVRRNSLTCTRMEGARGADVGAIRLHSGVDGGVKFGRTAARWCAFICALSK